MRMFQSPEGSTSEEYTHMNGEVMADNGFSRPKAQLQRNLLLPSTCNDTLNVYSLPLASTRGRS
ncbi:MAG: hypothetical protein HOO86_07155 [Bacteroidales bacterium]|nr:hypothetical protein [Bacteroidales bacterium]